MPAPIVSLTHALALRAEKTPARTAYVFLADGEEERDHLSYTTLEARARAIAAALSRSVAPGDRALLLDPPGLDFVAAFLGCLYAGVIAVPAYPPRSSRRTSRLLAILADARPAVALAAAEPVQRMRSWLERTPETAALSWLVTDELDPAPAGWEPPAPDGEAVAFLQYTSGSTSTPKGVRVTHGNLLHNEERIRQAFGQSESSVVVSWLPPYHDMGLIGGLLQPLYVGAPCILMPPAAFLQKPLRWLQAISRYRGTTSGGPNFAYELCVRSVFPAEIEQLDLSSWQVAFNGAEPVRRATLDRFATAFAPCGFRREAFVPCYGLAEATLLVTAGADRSVRSAAELPVRCGPLPAGDEVAVVDPASGKPCAAGAEGEIWVRGPSVAAGYWNRPAETLETFGAVLPEGRGPFLRTGDLGFVADGELVVSGRLKDLIILRGRNLHPQDLEATAREAHPALAGGMGAAFSVDSDGEERLVIVHEVERHAARPEEIAAAVRQAVTEEHEALAYEVVLVSAGRVPRTTSGKVQRRACRELYLQGGLRVLAASRLSSAVADEGAAAAVMEGSLEWLRRAFATAARVAPFEVDPDRPLSAAGLDSLAAVGLKQAVEEATGVSIPLTELLEGMTLREVERRVAAGERESPAPAGSGSWAAGEHPLSWNQRSLWFLHRLAPESSAYHIAGAARLKGAEAAALGRAFQGLVDRHPMLRVTFGETPEGPVQRVAERAEAGFEVVDATGWSDAEIQAWLQAEAFRPFDLSTGPLLRAAVLRRGEESFLVLAVHHVVADFWSLTVLARELGALLAGESPAPPAALYTDFVRRQQEMLASPAGERLWEHWRERLNGVPQLDLPTDRPRQPVQTLRGGSRRLAPSPERTEALHRLAATHGATPFVALLAAWQAVLSRWSGQEDFLTGAPMAGRSSRAWGEVVGYFVNLVPLRAGLSGDPTAGALLARTRRAVLDALAHQDLPFALLTERLQPERDLSRPPLVAAMLTFEASPVPALAALAAFPVAEPGVRIDLGGLALESLPLAPPAAQLDLSLTAGELPGGLAVLLQWDADLFDETTAGRMLGHLDRLLAGMVGADRPIAELPLLAAAERDQILLAWSGAEIAPAGTGCLHELFEAQVARTPEATALIAGDERWTYDALNRRANRLAHHLRRLGVGPEQRVGVMMSRSAELIAALLAVLKAGAAYVPLDPAYPADWRTFAAEDARITLLLTETAAEAVSRESEQNPEPLAGPGNLAYVLYTSGSTGRPKGVEIEHRAPVERMLWAREAFPADDLAGVLASTSVCFDLSVFEVFVPLSWGGTVILADHALALPVLPARDEVRLVNTVPSAMSELAAGELPPRLRTVNLAGESLPPQLVERIYRHPQVGLVLNLYGPTEDATYSTWARIERGATRVTIGCPLPGTRAYVLDRHLQPVPGGVPGELYLAGAGGARGYLGRPELTAERFLPDAFAPLPGGRLYRTGDLARWLATGALEHLGRIDHQVKVRGFRIELEEIEAALLALPGVREAVVVAREEPAGSDRPDRSTGGRRLVAYWVGDASTEAMRRHLGGRLPAYMVPSAFVPLAAFPLTPNGKVDRKALPAPVGAGEGFVAPRSAVEEVLAGIWAEVLGVGRVGLHDNFFDRGGHSLLATRVVSRLRSVFGVELPLRVLFERPTVETLAAAVEEARKGGGSAAAPPLVPVPREGALPLSFSQQRLWFIDQLEPGSPLYNVPGALRVEGPLDSRVLTLCLGEIVRRHEALRTVFPAVEGSPLQVIEPAEPFPLPVVDLTGLAESAREAMARSLLRDEAVRPFDLACGPLLRGLLVRLAADDHAVALTLHHIVSDGWSLGILVRELTALYPALAAGRPSPLPELPVQYADFAVWQRSWLCGEILEQEIAFWRQQLAGLPPLLELPTDRPRPAVQSYRGAQRPVWLPAELTRQAEALARREGATLFMVLLAGFQALLAYYSGQDDLAVGSPIAGRTRAEIESLIGFFVNTLVLRGDLSGEPSFRETLARVRETALAAYLHQDVPFEKLVEELTPERSLGHSPLSQVMLVLQSAPAGSLEIRGLRLRPVDGTGTTAKFDLTVSLSGDNSGLVGTAEYATDLFDGATIDRLIGHFERLLAAAVTGPEEPAFALSPLSPEERRQILVEWNATAAPFPRDLGLHELFEEQAARTPQATAVIAGERSVSYAEIEARANQLGRHLRRLGIEPDSLVAVAVPRSPEMVIALLGILKAGGAYLPLDPAWPRERLLTLAGEAGPRALVTLEPLLDRFPGGLPAVCLDRDRETLAAERQTPPAGGATAGNLAYVLYTSGSTGKPKGVAVPHRGVVRLVRGGGFARLDAGQVFLQLAPLSFDASTLEIWGALCNGGRLVLAPSEPPSPAELGRLITRHGVTTLWLTAGLFHQMVDEEPASLRGLSQLLAGGDALSPSHVRRALAALPDGTLINGYGPTENTTFTCCHVITDAAADASVPIGRPIGNTTVVLLDRAGRPVPVGVPGELYTGGDGLARGYLDRPDLTAERFVPSALTGAQEEAGARLYRTGDLARRRADGTLDFLGRIDRQVKIRGFRIEPGEIEAALLTHPGVQEALVEARDIAGNKALVAYVAGEEPPSTAELRSFLGERLPGFMVPAAWIFLPALPLTANGKVDRKALAALRPERSGAEAARAPRKPAEELLAGIFAEVLEVERVGLEDNFFALGGHSLLATRVVSRVRSVFGVELPVRALFEAPTVESLAADLEAAATGEHPPLAPLCRAGRSQPLPLSFAQQRLWFLYLLEPESPAFIIGDAMRLTGALAPGALAASLGETVRRHEVLRTRYQENGEGPIQTIDPAAPSPLPLVDLGGLRAEARERELRRLAEREMARPFDLTRDWPLRTHLLRLSPEEHAILFALHHIAGDGWSLGLLIRELGALYATFSNGHPAALPELAVQYADFAVWQRGWLSGERMEGQLSWWRDRLSGPLPVLELPQRRNRPDTPGFRGAACPVAVPLGLRRSLEEIGHSEGATLFMILLAGFKALLHHYGGQEDLIVGTNVANRERSEIEGLIGCFINSLALRTDLSGDPGFRELVRRVRDAALGAFAHQEVPFEKVLEAVQPQRETSFAPLFQVMFVLQNFPAAAWSAGGLEIAPLGLEVRTANFDLTLVLREEADGLMGTLQYDTDLFAEEAMARMTEHFLALLHSVAADPDQALSEISLTHAGAERELVSVFSEDF
jgi:amino acid adenylation domain-containing protein